MFKKSKSVLIYSEELASFEFSPAHPFKPIRAKLMIDLCRRYGLLDKPGISIVKPQPLSFEEMAKFHDPEYLRALQIANSLAREKLLASSDKLAAQFLQYRLGTEDNPLFPGLFDFSALAAGATYLGVDWVSSGQAQVAFNPLGGFHHARRNRAAGFCYVNDVAIAIMSLLEEGRRVAFVDIDAHHGDGMQEAFYGENRVLVISFHESGKFLYPWTGFEDEIGEGKGRGYNVNFPLPQGSDDEAFIKALTAVVPPLLESYNPDLVIAELGADMHIADPLTHLKITNVGYSQAIKIIAANSPRIVALGGGGYDIYKTARNWTLAWAILSNQDPRDEYAGLVGGMMYGPEVEAGELYDTTITTRGREKEKIQQEVERIIAYIKKVIFPIHKI